MVEPAELGLPYSTWRAGQAKLLTGLLAKGPRVRGITAPTGAGKSAVYIGLAAMLAETGKRTAILTATRGLQDQLARDFKELLFDVRGASNYHCIGFDKGRQFESLASYARRKTCDEGPCHHGLRCAYKASGCLYYDTVRWAQVSPIVATNYAMWFASYAYGDGLGTFDALVCDEAHDLPDELSGFLEIKIPLDRLRRYEILPPTSRRARMDTWRAWAAKSAGRLTARLDGVRRAPSAEPGGPMESIGSLAAAAESKQLLNDLTRLAQSRGKWLHWEDRAGDGVGLCWAPLWPTPYAEAHLWRSIPRIIAVSATLRPKTLGLLGIGEPERCLGESEHPFPIERRPIFLMKSIGGLAVPRVQYNWTPAEQAAWVECLDRILDLWPHDKGLIHTVSYGRAKLYAQSSRHASRLWTHWSGNTREKVERFKQSRGNGVLVSPAMTTGWDFPDSTARFNIIAKVPFPDSTSPLVKARCREDDEYRYLLAAVAMQQAAGRIVRSPTDWGSTYIVDGHALWFQWRHDEMFARWYLEAVSDEDDLPAPRRFDGPDDSKSGLTCNTQPS